MILEVYDLECLKNLFTYTGYCPKEDKYYQFCICQWKNELKELHDHLLRDKIIQVGYNCKGYDSPLETNIMRHYDEYKLMTGQEVAQALYNKSQEIIESEFSALSDKNDFCKQIDTYLIAHYNNNARKSSLKDLEIAMRLPNVEEMPIHHTTWCKPGDEEQVLSYNLNDVFATYQFFLTLLGKTDNPLYKGKNKIELRQKLQKRYGIQCLNWPDVKIGEQLVLKLYCDKTGNNLYDIKKKGGTRRSKIALKDCIPHWANFETPEFNSVKKKFEDTIITNIKGSFNHSLFYQNVIMDYGTGGLHSSASPGVYEADDYWMILDEDIGLA